MASTCTLIAQSLTHSWHTHLGTSTAHSGLAQGTRRWSDAVGQPGPGEPMETGDDETTWASCRGDMGTTPARTLHGWVLCRSTRVRGPGSYGVLAPVPVAVAVAASNRKPVCLKTCSLIDAIRWRFEPSARRMSCA